MDILRILNESKIEDIYLDDLDFFETELATGEEYDSEYKEVCKAKIQELRYWLINGRDEEQSNENQVKKSRKKKSTGVTVRLSDIAPEENNSFTNSLTTEQIIFQDINTIRKERTYKTSFKKYVRGNDKIDLGFIEKNISFFKNHELDAILSVKKLPEEFLEKYFGSLNHDKIARYQYFSEEFFIKHFSQFDASIVLEHGVNNWRLKENRSKQLDVFLRLKGVKI